MFRLFLVLYLFTSLQVHCQVKSEKRGVSYGHHTEADISAASKGISWWYNWATQPDIDIRTSYSGYNVEFVPMAWNASGIDGVRSWVSQDPKVKYILGFNEPNFIDQANMTPSQAAAAWPRLQAIADQYGLKLVSPAVNYCGNCVQENGKTYNDPFTWLDDFFTACQGCRVDYIGLHWYGGGTSITGYVDKARKYGKPIWVTEFANWEPGITSEDQRNYMAGTVNFLERDPDVLRYSWFIGRASGANVYPYIDLYAASGELTSLGKLYNDIPIFDPEKSFAIPGRIEAEEYHSQRGLFSELTRDIDGFMNIGYTDSGDWLEYNIKVAVSGNYFLTARYSGTSFGSFDIIIDDVKRGSINMDATGGWQNWSSASSSIHLDAGSHKLKLVVVNKGFNLNWLDFAAGSADQPTGINDYTEDREKVLIYPNPVTGDKFKVSLMDFHSSIYLKISNLNGEEIYSRNFERPGDQGIEINLKESGIIDKGIYLISIKSRDSYLVKKIVVM